MGSERKGGIKSVISRILNEDPSRIFLLPADNARELGDGENFLLCESELVRHSIIFTANMYNYNRRYRLDFEAEGGIQSLLNGEHPHTPILPLSEILTKLKGPGSIDRRRILKAYQEVAFTDTPQCRPCDTDFIGSFSTKLMFINGVRPTTCQEIFVNEFGMYDTDPFATRNLDPQLIEGMIPANIEQDPEADYELDAFRSVESLIIEGDTITSDQLAHSYAIGSCYQYAISDLALMIEDEDLSLNREEWNRLCIDLLAQTNDAEQVLSAIEQIANRA